MEYSADILGYEEQVSIRLRTLYSEFGYVQYKMSRFEEYELYAGNKAFLPPGEILTFAGAGGRLMALRPDVTLSIVKYTKDDNDLKKLYYNENIYRSDGFEIKEQMQVGLECIGNIDVSLMGEVLLLAKRSLDTISGCTSLDISHMGYLSGLLIGENMNTQQKTKLINCISEKNNPGLRALCYEYRLSNDFCERLIKLSAIYGPFKEVAGELQNLSINKETDAAIQELDKIHDTLCQLGIRDGVNIDFSVVNDISYYSGIIFQGYIKGIPAKVLSGGRYDELLNKFGKKCGAIGFAVYLDMLENPDAAETNKCTEANTETKNDKSPEKDTGFEVKREAGMINIALPKGRLGENAYDIFESSGFGCPEIREESRKLVFENKKDGVRYFWVKPSDVARYVERGAADIGVAGKDVLLEGSPDVYELLDLGIGRCSLCVAAEMGFDTENSDKALRVATKFPNIARSYYRKQGREIDVIELNGSIELAPLLGLSDVIVDIVETGRTLQENKMEPIEPIVDISARLISNKASYKFNHKKIETLCAKIAENLSKINETNKME